jgi:hypothetical protein
MVLLQSVPRQHPQPMQTKRGVCLSPCLLNLLQQWNQLRLKLRLHRPQHYQRRQPQCKLLQRRCQRYNKLLPRRPALAFPQCPWRRNLRTLRHCLLP